jgi:hypothetical protein
LELLDLIDGDLAFDLKTYFAWKNKDRNAAKSRNLSRSPNLLPRLPRAFE